MAAEYTLGVAANPNPQTSYLTTDALGSLRVATDAAGRVIARHDYLPFGDEILGLGARTSAQGYGQPDTIRQRFTGYEKDTESGLDFAQARYYGEGMGRFTGVDPALKSIILSAPQSWNRFSYVDNNPTNSTDPSGLCPIGGCSPYSGPVYSHDNLDGTTSYADHQMDGYTPYEGPATSFRDLQSGVWTEVTSGGWRSISQEEASTVHPGADIVQTSDTEISSMPLVTGAPAEKDSASVSPSTPLPYKPFRDCEDCGFYHQIEFEPLTKFARMPDAGTFSWGILWFGQTYTLDAYGHLYVTPFDFLPRFNFKGNMLTGFFKAFKFGVSAGPVYILDANPPTEKESENFFTGPSVTGTAGYWGGGSVTYSPGVDRAAIMGGFVTPGGGISVQTTAEKYDTFWTGRLWGPL